MRLRQREHVYRTRLWWTGETTSYANYTREHRIDFDGKPTIVASADLTFLGDPARHNPEELLLAALSSCHMLSYLAHCARAGIVVVAYHDEAQGTMVETGGAGRFARALLRPRATIASGDLERARALHEDAHRDCFIASSVNFPVEHEATVEQPASPSEGTAPASSVARDRP